MPELRKRHINPILTVRREHGITAPSDLEERGNRKAEEKGKEYPAPARSGWACQALEIKRSHAGRILPAE